MKVPIIFCISLVLLLMLLEVNTENLDSRSKNVNQSTSSASVSASSTSKTSEASAQAKKKRYATREVILYLTPSQIKALEAGEGLVSLQSLSEPVDQAQPTIQDLKLKEQTEFVKQELENIKSASVQPVEHQFEENLESAFQEPILQKDLLFREHQQELDDQWRQEFANQEEQLKLHKYYHELNKAEQLKLQQEVHDKINTWLKYNPNIHISEGYNVQEQQQIDQSVGRNKFQLKALNPLPLYDQNAQRIISQTPKPLLQLEYSPKYNDQQKAIEIEQILKLRHHHELEKQSALSQAEKIANAPAIVLHDHVQITKQHAIPVVKHVQVPVPASAWVSVPEFIPVRVPHEYPIHQQIINNIHVPIEQRDNLEIERPVPKNAANAISGPFNKIIFLNVGTPYVDQKIVPGEIKPWSVDISK